MQHQAWQQVQLAQQQLRVDVEQQILLAEMAPAQGECGLWVKALVHHTQLLSGKLVLPPQAKESLTSDSRTAPAHLKLPIRQLH